MEGQLRTDHGAASFEVKCVGGEKLYGCRKDRNRAFHSNGELRNTFTKAFENKGVEKQISYTGVQKSGICQNSGGRGYSFFVIFLSCVEGGDCFIMKICYTNKTNICTMGKFVIVSVGRNHTSKERKLIIKVFPDLGCLCQQ